VAGFESNNVRALLAYVAIESERPHNREKLAGLLWPNQPGVVARSNLRQTLANLRQAIGDEIAQPPFLNITRESIQFNIKANHWLDVTAFSTLLAASEKHLHRHADTCKRCAQWLHQAVELYRGNFLDNFYVSDSWTFEEWVLIKRESMRHMALNALARLTDFNDRLGSYEQAYRYAARQLEFDPWREEAHQQAMRALALSGQRSAALTQYETCRRVLAKELGVDPTNDTQELYEHIKTGKTLIGSNGSTFQPTNLPAQTTPFVGRETELVEIAELLENPSCRLVTFTGPGGIGKTRLAVQAAAEQVGTFTDGIFFVPLTTLKSTENCVTAIAEALNFTFSSQGNLKQQLINHLCQKEMLLVLDNFEHLLSTSPTERDGNDRAVGLLAEILQQSPRISLLVTTRERLNLQSEWVYDLKGLSFPQSGKIGDIEHYDAVQLFVQRASQVNRQFSFKECEANAIVRICQLVEGMPLAIELAAAAVRARSCTTIAAEIESGIRTLVTTMHDIPEQHRSLWAVFEHSWCLLSQQERIILQRLSVFHGGFQEDAAACVAEATSPLLLALMEKSLLRKDEVERYDMHELVRLYAHEKLLEASQIEQTQMRHSAYYLNLAEQAEFQLNGVQQQIWIERLEREHDNIRTALRWSIEHDAGNTAARIGGAIWLFWWMHGHLSEGRGWLEQALLAGSRSEVPLTSAVRAKVLNGAGALAYQQGDYVGATALLEDCLTLRQDTGNTRVIANVLNSLGLVALEQGDHSRAKSLCEESLALFRQLGDEIGVDKLLNNLANLAFDQCDYTTANALYEESLMLSRKRGDKDGSALSLTNLGWAALLQDNPERAASLCREALVLCRALGNRPILAFDLEGLAGVAGTQGQAIRAARLFGAANALREAIHFPLTLSNKDYYERITASARTQLGETAFTTAWAEGSAMTLEEAIAYALSEMN
jgi:predicted ATPase/DNA-binding SARP family transcriptional activator